MGKPIDKFEDVLPSCRVRGSIMVCKAAGVAFCLFGIRWLFVRGPVNVFHIHVRHSQTNCAVLTPECDYFQLTALGENNLSVVDCRGRTILCILTIEMNIPNQLYDNNIHPTHPLVLNNLHKNKFKRENRISWCKLLHKHKEVWQPCKKQLLASCFDLGRVFLEGPLIL